MRDTKNEVEQEVTPILDDALASHDGNAWAFAAIQDLRKRVAALENSKEGASTGESGSV